MKQHLQRLYTARIHQRRHFIISHRGVVVIRPRFESGVPLVRVANSEGQLVFVRRSDTDQSAPPARKSDEAAQSGQC